MRKSSLIIAILLAACVNSQAQKTTPTFKTEDVMKWREENPELAAKYIPKSDPNEKRNSSKADQEFLAAEKEWNVRLSQAKNRLRNFEISASQAELSATKSRNVFMHASPDDLNRNNARVSELNSSAAAFRSEVRAAQDEINDLLDYGREYGFMLYSISPTQKNGEPNEDYYRSRFLDLQADLNAAIARANVMQNRTNRLNTTINTNLSYPEIYYGASYNGILFYPNTGAADTFYLNRLRNNLAEVNGDLRSSQARIDLLNQQLEELKEAGRRAGIAAGVFR
jgi:hypothetical protein